MKLMHRAMVWLVGGVVAVGGVARASEGDEIALAERIASLADAFDNSAVSGAAKGSLYETAGRLADREVRFRRQRFRSAQNAGDAESMLATLLEWRKLEPDNLFVQMRLIDVYEARMETTDARINYLKTIVGAESVHREVRSHAADQMARLYLEQSRVQQALEMTRLAVQLNALNSEALQLEWHITSGRGSPLEQINLLLAILKANPSSVATVLQVANKLADIGMTSQSVSWYGHAANMSRSMGGLAGESARDFAAELLISGQDRAAAEMTSRMLEKDNTNTGAWLLTLVAERDMKDRIEEVKKSAQVGMLNRLAVVRRALGVVEATTRPLTTDEVEAPDIKSDIELFSKANQTLQSNYIGAVADVTWFFLYYREKTDVAAAMIKQLETIAPENKAMLARLHGWLQLLTGKRTEAIATFTPLVDSDPFAGLGLFRALQQDPATRAEASELARKLMRLYPSRTAGAIIRAEVAQAAGEMPHDPITDAILDSLDRFPREVLRMSAAPQEFVGLRMTPQQIGHDFGEPMLLEMEIRNVQDQPMVIGPNGMVKDVWVDGQLRGLVHQRASDWVPGVILEKIDGPVVLPSGGTSKFVVRLDRGPLATILDEDVMQSMQLTAFGTTNVVPTEVGMLPGPCGIRAKMNQLLERRSGSLASEAAMKKAETILDGTDNVAKLRLADQIYCHLKVIADPESPQALKAMDKELRTLLVRLTLDSAPTVRAWATYRRGGSTVDPGDRTAQELVAEHSWYARVLGIMTAANLPEQTRAKVLETVSHDGDATVRRLANSVNAAIEHKKANPDG